MRNMIRRDAITAVGSLLVLAASTIAGTTIWALLTAPATVASQLNGLDGQPLRFVVRVMSDVLVGVFRHL
jgi:hypothetical protein